MGMAGSGVDCWWVATASLARRTAGASRRHRADVVASKLKCGLVDGFLVADDVAVPLRTTASGNCALGLPVVV